MREGRRDGLREEKREGRKEGRRDWLREGGKERVISVNM